MHTIFTIRSYDEGSDTFLCVVNCEMPFESQVPAWVMPHLTGECGDPFEMVGREFRAEFKPA